MSEPVDLFFHAESETWTTKACGCGAPEECHRAEDGDMLAPFKALPVAAYDELVRERDALREALKVVLDKLDGHDIDCGIYSGDTFGCPECECDCGVAKARIEAAQRQGRLFA